MRCRSLGPSSIPHVWQKAFHQSSSRPRWLSSCSHMEQNDYKKQMVSPRGLWLRSPEPFCDLMALGSTDPGMEGEREETKMGGREEIRGGGLAGEGGSWENGGRGRQRDVKPWGVGVTNRLDQPMNNSDPTISFCVLGGVSSSVPSVARHPPTDVGGDPRTVSSEFLDRTAPSSRPIFAVPEPEAC